MRFKLLKDGDFNGEAAGGEVEKEPVASVNTRIVSVRRDLPGGVWQLKFQWETK